MTLHFDSLVPIYFANFVFLTLFVVLLFAVFFYKWLHIPVVSLANSVRLVKLLFLGNYKKLTALLDGWRHNCKEWTCNKLDLLILTMVHGILIDLHLEALPMIMDVKRNIEEGSITIILMNSAITVTKDITKCSTFLVDKSLVLMVIVILMCI